MKQFVIMVGLILLAACGGDGTDSGATGEAGGSGRQTAELTVSVQQKELLEMGTQVAERLLEDSDQLLPTLYAHNGEESNFVTLGATEAGQVPALAREALRNEMPGAVAYAVVYFAELDLGDERRGALVMETGDEMEGAALRLFRLFDPETRTFGEALNLMGETENLLAGDGD